MHASGGGSIEAMKKLKAISAAFGGAIIHRVVSYYAVGILYDWHVFTWYDPMPYWERTYSLFVGSTSGVAIRTGPLISRIGAGSSNGLLPSSEVVSSLVSTLPSPCLQVRSWHGV